MTRLRNNIIANFGGQAWAVLMSVVFVPLYLRLLGIEAFGLVSFMLSLQMLSQLFDFGIGGAINRELARRIHRPGDGGVRDLVRSAEMLVWPLAFLVGLIIFVASPVIATAWLHPQHMTQAETAEAVMTMGIAVATLWPTSFYSSALSGLEQQATMNLVNSLFATLRGGGVLIAMHVFGPTLHVFLVWHALVGIGQSLTLAAVLWRLLPAGDRRPRFDVAALVEARRFAGGLFAITALALAVSQLDRLALSSMRPLAEMGYYGLAISVAAGLGRMVQPMFNALYPRLSRLVANGDNDKLVELYHLSTQCLVLVVAAISFVLMFFGGDVLLLWTGDAALARIAAQPMAILVAGTALNGLMTLPYALQLAHGWTRPAILSNLAGLILGIPYVLWAVPEFGMAGAAGLGLLLNAGNFLVLAPIVHRRLLPGRLKSWYLQDLLPPVIAAGAVAGLARLLVPEITPSLGGLLILSAVSFATLAAAFLVAPLPRRIAVDRLTARRR